MSGSQKQRRRRSDEGSVDQAAVTLENGGELSTRDRILDAAEHLFGERNFDSVSLRDISNEAKVNLGLVHYHFRSKDTLFEKVIARRAEEIGRVRRARLETLTERGDPTIEQILDAFMAPMFELMSSAPGWHSYALVLSQVGSSSRWLSFLERYFDDTAMLFVGALRKALPEVSERELMYGFSFTLVVMLNTVAQNKRLDSLSGGKILAVDLKQAYPPLITYVAQGLKGLTKAQVRSAPKLRLIHTRRN